MPSENKSYTEEQFTAASGGYDYKDMEYIDVWMNDSGLVVTNNVEEVCAEFMSGQIKALEFEIHKETGDLAMFLSIQAGKVEVSYPSPDDGWVEQTFPNLGNFYRYFDLSEVR